MFFAFPLQSAYLEQNDSAFITLHCSIAQAWNDKPIGIVNAMVAQLFITRDYKAGTLEQPGPEHCRFTSEGFDCVTLAETVLALARSIKQGHCNYDQFLRELQQLRYRDGKVQGYLSRLHYTAEWISDNQKKGLLRNITTSLGGKRLHKRITFMSTHPELYPALRDSNALIPHIRAIERRLSRDPLVYIPISKLSSSLAAIQSGDIIAFVSAKEGLDYAHLGIALRSQGKLGIIHASSRIGKVVYEPDLTQYVRSVQGILGITVARPLEPSQLRNTLNTNSRIDRPSK